MMIISAVTRAFYTLNDSTGARARARFLTTLHYNRHYVRRRYRGAHRAKSDRSDRC